MDDNVETIDLVDDFGPHQKGRVRLRAVSRTPKPQKYHGDVGPVRRRESWTRILEWTVIGDRQYPQFMQRLGVPL